ncbi:MAG: hypothetical protein Greene041614_409 [Parcubacteria group bacterium Greene0416_14]|nr:MAG: hypothetical protein Greene041614_409 [Parcubacteria group bacterium Greene0416_14]
MPTMKHKERNVVNGRNEFKNAYTSQFPNPKKILWSDWKIEKRYVVGGVFCMLKNEVKFETRQPYCCSPRKSLPMRNSVSSRICGAINCTPNGSFPLSVTPEGTASAGTPTMFAGTVNISARYICKGSAVLSPIGNAGVGAVGVIIACTRFSFAPKTVSKSCATKFRTLFALL